MRALLLKLDLLDGPAPVVDLGSLPRLLGWSRAVTIEEVAEGSLVPPLKGAVEGRQDLADGQEPAGVVGARTDVVRRDWEA